LSLVQGVRTKDMQGIFEDERRRSRPISTHPCGTGRIFPPAALRLLDGAPHHLRNRAWLGGKIHSRRQCAVNVNTT
jgi:hypothetical protein